jgi:hypothetical protein
MAELRVVTCKNGYEITSEPRVCSEAGLPIDTVLDPGERWSLPIEPNDDVVEPPPPATPPLKVTEFQRLYNLGGTIRDGGDGQYYFVTDTAVQMGENPPGDWLYLMDGLPAGTEEGRHYYLDGQITVVAAGDGSGLYIGFDLNEVVKVRLVP